MKILTTQDFNQIPYNVPNAQAVDPNGNAQENIEFATYIDNTVNDIMAKILGGSLYESFLAGLDALPLAWIEANSPGYLIDDEVFYNNHVWKSLVDTNLNVIPGADPTKWVMVEDNKWLMLYNGSLYGRGTWVGLKTMLIPYVYALWLRDTYDEHTKVGVIRRTAENATVIDPTKRIARAYNTFSTYMGSYYRQYSTLFGYLMYAQTLGHYTGFYDTTTYELFGDYLRYSFKVPGRMNIFNI